MVTVGHRIKDIKKKDGHSWFYMVIRQRRLHGKKGQLWSKMVTNGHKWFYLVISSHGWAHYTGGQEFMVSKVQCVFFLNFALPPFSLPLPSVVQLLGQNRHWTFCTIYSWPPVHASWIPSAESYEMLEYRVTLYQDFPLNLATPRIWPWKGILFGQVYHVKLLINISLGKGVSRRWR